MSCPITGTAMVNYLAVPLGAFWRNIALPVIVIPLY
jgi:hypothetical protein